MEEKKKSEGEYHTAVSRTCHTTIFFREFLYSGWLQSHNIGRAWTAMISRSLYAIRAAFVAMFFGWLAESNAAAGSRTRPRPDWSAPLAASGERWIAGENI